MCQRVARSELKGGDVTLNSEKDQVFEWVWKLAKLGQEKIGEGSIMGQVVDGSGSGTYSDWGNWKWIR